MPKYLRSIRKANKKLKEIKEREEELFKKYGCKPLQVVLPPHEEFEKLLVKCKSISKSSGSSPSSSSSSTSSKVSPKPTTSSSEASSCSGSSSPTLHLAQPVASTSFQDPASSVTSDYFSSSPASSTLPFYNLDSRGKLIIPDDTEETLQLLQSIVQDVGFPTECLPELNEDYGWLQDEIDNCFKDTKCGASNNMFASYNLFDLNDAEFSNLYDSIFNLSNKNKF